MKEVEDNQVLINNKFEINKGKTDDLFKKSNQVHKDLLQLISQIKTKIKKKKKQLKNTTNDRVDLAQYGRRNMVEVAGIPHTNEEN